MFWDKKIVIKRLPNQCQKIGVANLNNSEDFWEYFSWQHCKTSYLFVLFQGILRVELSNESSLLIRPTLPFLASMSQDIFVEFLLLRQTFNSLSASFCNCGCGTKLQTNWQHQLTSRMFEYWHLTEETKYLKPNIVSWRALGNSRWSSPRIMNV